MRSLLLLSVIPISLNLAAQYGSFDASAMKAAKTQPTLVVLDGGSTPYDQAITNAVKGDWKFTGEYDFITAGDLAMQPMAPDRTYLMKVHKSDPAKHDGVFLSLVQGWKQKKGEALEQKNNAFSNIPPQQELAFILMDPKTLSERNAMGMITLYVKHLQDYAGLVANGKITDRTTADRIYSGRNRHIRDTQLLLGKEHLDQTITGLETVTGVYPAGVEIVPVSQLINAIEEQDRTMTVSDVVVTGEYKTKHCFKRIFNAGTGELMYLKDEPALHGKKEGFMDEDLKTVARSR
jgi:hypothetical protein